MAAVQMKNCPAKACRMQCGANDAALASAVPRGGSRSRTRASQSGVGAAALHIAVFCILFSSAAAGADENLFANPGFEEGVAGWHADRGGETEAEFVVQDGRAAEGRRSALVTIGKVSEWGVQFGQYVASGKRGGTWTFSVMARSEGEPVTVDLQIERHANPYDRAARSGRFQLVKDRWTELHVTFTVEKDFPEGWFAYVSCTQPNSRFRVDMCRLEPGAHVPFEQYMQRREKAERAAAALVAAHAYDTGKPAAEPLAGDELAKRAGWVELPEDTAEHAFKGDAVLTNHRVALVLRRGAAGAELYSLEGGAKLRAVLSPAAGSEGGTADARLSSVQLVENSPAAATADVQFAAADGKPAVLRYELGMGQAFVKTEARAGAAALRVAAPCRFAVLPDFFADDIVADAAALPGEAAELPSENFLMHLLPGGEAIVMNVWSQADEDVQVRLTGAHEQRRIAASQVAFGAKGKVWTAVLAGGDIWHERDIAVKDADKQIALSWRRPFPAQWRVDWRRSDGLTDTWEMIVQQANGAFTKYGWFGSASTIPADRKRWTTVLGNFLYPCWLDAAGQGHLQPLKAKSRFDGPAVLYPISRVKDTPLEALTVVDVVRSTLGVGPCEYILDVEGQQQQYRGRATCGVRDTLNPIYAAGRQKAERQKVEQTLVELMAFIRHIRGRIEHYVDFGHQLLEYLGAQKKAHPQLAAGIEEQERLTRDIDARFAARAATIKTPDDVAAMVAEFRKDVLDYEGKDAAAKCGQYTAAWVRIGGGQDELVGECRLAVKILRQRAGLLMAADPAMAEVCREVRQRTRDALRNPTVHEAARH